MNTWTVCIHFSSIDSLEKFLQRVEKCLITCDEHRNKGVERMPCIAKKRHLKKKFEKRLISSFQKIKSTKSNGSFSAETIEKDKKTKLELELIKKLYIVF